ncbi:hypothetical protein cyc_06176 [Cyclospora cayetanensis]|uniref:Uncharacterized protein n=1 Tax=Cyclospora cayetanensis TaxID=88456 RepID=A0A1D3D7F5_9EIME|nr:hypothetical protein cyc_06176 [Cyclospora cayetanensis]
MLRVSSPWWTFGLVSAVAAAAAGTESQNAGFSAEGEAGEAATAASVNDAGKDGNGDGRTRGGSEEGGWEWDAEEIASFASQIHEKMRQQLEQEAAFMDIALKSGFAVMKGALAIEDDTKMLIREGRLAGLGLTPLDDDTHTHLNRIDLSMLLTLTPDNYARRLLGTSGISDQLRSPLFKMHRELALLGSTSSEDSVSESESEHSRTSKNDDSQSGSAAAASVKAPPGQSLDSPGAGVRSGPPLPVGVPRLQLGSQS